jgi:ubiquinol-cytochrome c reductase cytochrome c subunit
MEPWTAKARSVGGVSWRMLGGYLVLIAVIASVLVAAGGGPGPAPRAMAAEPDGAVRERAAALYLQNCASCHGPQGEGAPAGPPLIGVGEASADFYLRTGRMPLGAPGQRPERQEPYFSEEDIAALVAYVGAFDGGPAIPQVFAGGDLHRGWELYTANCAACHAATGAGNAVGGGFAAVGLQDATPLEIAEAMIVGPGVMPRFGFEQEDQDAIIAYVEFLRESPSPGGAPLGGFGPVGEGFVAIVVGLTLMVLVARWVGRRSHEGEPLAGGAPEDRA